MTSTRRTVAVAAPALFLAAGARAPAPRRVVSLNPCLDAILVEVADRSQIAALSHFSRSPHDSTIAALARTFPQSYESAEEVLVLRPDLVLASRHSSPATRAALARFGAPEELFGIPATVEASLEQVARVARLVGHAERGAALTARIRAALAAATPPAGARPLSALVFQPTGLVAGPGHAHGRHAQAHGLRERPPRATASPPGAWCRWSASWPTRPPCSCRTRPSPGPPPGPSGWSPIRRWRRWRAAWRAACSPSGCSTAAGPP